MKIALIGACCIGLWASTGLSAKERPKREPEDARKATGCEYLGPGFQRIEGSDTCVRMGGSVSATGSWSVSR